MSAMVARSPGEVAGLRAAAGTHIDRSDHDRIVCPAVLRTLDWVAGRGPTPLDGEAVAADEDRIALEQLRAQDREDDLARRGGNGHVEPGAVAQTLRWYRGYSRVEAPVL